MKLKKNWKTVLKSAWSIKLMAVAGILSGLEAALPILDDAIHIPRGLFAILSFIAVTGAAIARLVVQVEFPNANSE